MYLSTVFGALALTSLVSAKVHIVKVAPNDDLVFSPNKIKAAKGDQIQFEFEDEGHSVAQGDFSNACQPSTDSDAFFSGSPDSGPWTITINDDDPIAFYCATPGHCEAGMVGVINPSAGNTLAAYKKAAAGAGSSKAPPKVQGGQFKAASGGSTTSSASASGSSSATSTPSNGAGALVLSSLAAIVPLGVLAYFAL